MTREQLERIIATWQERLRLRDWDVKISVHEADSENDAEIHVHDYHEQASIRLNPKWVDWDVGLANRVIVHELLHIHEQETKRPVDQAQNAMTKPAYEMLWGWYVAGRERWIEKLAQAIVDMAGAVE